MKKSKSTHLKLDARTLLVFNEQSHRERSGAAPGRDMDTTTTTITLTGTGKVYHPRNDAGRN